MGDTTLEPDRDIYTQIPVVELLAAPFLQVTIDL